MEYSTRRIITIDVIRTLAISLMVVFHFIYDLKFFGWVDSGIPDGEGWREFRYLILSLFFICVGCGLVFTAKANSPKSLRKYFLRLAKVGVAAMLVTLMSLVMVPENYIYFGVLHFIFVGSILVYPVINRPTLALGLGVIILAGYWADWLSVRWPFNYILYALPDYTNDYVPLFPWLAIICLGIWLGHQKWLQHDPLKFACNKPWLYLPGRHSLMIYLLHQPLFFALFFGINWLI